MRVLKWLWNHWYVPLAVVAAIVAALLWKKPKGVPVTQVVIDSTKKELEVIEAQAEVRRLKAELGAEQARQHVEDKYREAKSKLTAEQAEKAKRLEKDPVALAKFLVRAGR